MTVNTTLLNSLLSHQVHDQITRSSWCRILLVARKSSHGTMVAAQAKPQQSWLATQLLTSESSPPWKSWKVIATASLRQQQSLSRQWKSMTRSSTKLTRSALVTRRSLFLVWDRLSLRVIIMKIMPRRKVCRETWRTWSMLLHWLPTTSSIWLKGSPRCPHSLPQ